MAWSRQEGVPQAIFTHCGSSIIQGEAHGIAEERLQAFAAEQAVEIAFAYDGLRVVLR